MGMLGIAYAKRSLKGASRGSESGNLSRASNHSIQAPFAPLPSGLVQPSSFFIHNFSFSPRPARIRHLTALCSRKAVPPCGSRYRVIFRACSHGLGSAIFIFHSSFFISSPALPPPHFSFFIHHFSFSLACPSASSFFIFQV
jgi:hypothetical protein